MAYFKLNYLPICNRGGLVERSGLAHTLVNWGQASTQGEPFKGQPRTGEGGGSWGLGVCTAMEEGWVGPDALGSQEGNGGYLVLGIDLDRCISG